jgi:peroxiredoxin
MSLSIGASAPDFSLPATDGRTCSYADIAGAQATVVMFWCNHCPYVIGSQQRVKALQAEYADRGVRFAAICANNPDAYPQDSFENMATRARAEQYNFPYLHDPSQAVAQDYGAQRTPEAFLFDAEGKLRYHGRIDDNPQNEGAVVQHDLRNALEAVLAGREPEVAETGAIGCSIKWR